MTDIERQNPGGAPAPEPDAGTGAATPPPAPYEQPPLPGESSPKTPNPASTPQPYGADCPLPPAQAPCPPHPQQPYAQNPPAPGAPQPFGQTPPPQAYQQPPYPPYGAGQQPPYPPYPGQPPYPAAPQPPQKRKVWPWVLAGCLVALLLGLGGCVSCVSCAVIADNVGNRIERDRYGYDDPYDYGYGYGDPYGLDDPQAYGTFTLDEIKGAAENLPSAVEDGRCTPGVFTVGSDSDLKPGLYFLEGSQTLEGSFSVFDRTSANEYEIDDSVVYFGNYFTELDEGDVILFDPGDAALRFYLAAKADFKPQAPYRNGLYRVGTDLPAGTYAIEVDESAAANATQESAAFVMKNLDFDSDSITDTRYVVVGGSQSVTVKEGDYLELYAATAKASSQTAPEAG